MAWSDSLFRGAVAAKYAQQGQQIAAAAAEARSRANLNNQNAAQVAPLAQSQIGLERTQGNLNNQNAFKAGQEGLWVGPRAIAEINSLNAGSRLNNVQADVLPVRTAGDYAANVGSANASNATAVGIQRDRQALGLDTRTQFPPMLPLTPAGAVTLDQSQNLTLGAPAADAPVITPRRALPQFDDLSSFLRPYRSTGSSLGFKRGVTSVPGKGTGDKVPAKLEPKEAVLNKHAADMLGRKKIAELNKKGNEKRANEMHQRVSKLAQSLTKIGMV